MRPWSCPLLALIVLLAGAPVFAQGAYVGAALTGDLVRYSGSNSEGVPEISQGGEALGFALRLGTPLGSNWGVEAEVSRTSAIDTAWTVHPRFVVEAGLFQVLPSGTLVGESTTFGLEPDAFRRRERSFTLSTGVWARQDLSNRISVAYLGGVGFGRAEIETERTEVLLVSVLPGPAAPTRRLSSAVIRSTIYGVRPFAGIESRVAMTERLQLVPGVRLHALEGGWLLRPSVGLAWAF